MTLHEDEHLLVINKPAGWNTHAPSPFAGEGAYEWLKHREPRWARLAIIHRLDKETSGVLVFGKSTDANRSLTQQFTERRVRKTYALVTDRPLKQKHFTAASSLVRAGEKYVSQPLRPGGERAETRFRVVAIEPGRNLIEAEPTTGRTHQIRVHAAEHGFPILGDRLYGGTPAERVFLHAAELSLRHPTTGELLTFCAPCDWSVRASLADEAGEMPVVRSASVALRAAIVEPQLTDSFRYLHGASDGSPWLYVDKLADFLLAQCEGTLDTRQREHLEAIQRECGSRGAYHKRLSRRVRGATIEETSPQLVFGDVAPERFTIRENGLNFEVSLSEGYSVGLFLDQRDNRRRFLVNHVAAEFPLFPHGATVQVLNTFGYTCGFSVAAAKSGAHTTSLDLSKKYLEWGKRNFALNGIDSSQHDFIYGDAFDWMRRLTKKGRSFDCIILDPPTFSQSKAGGTWQAEKDYGKLVTAALPLLKPNAVLLASTNAAKLEAERFLAMIGESVTKARRKVLQQHYVPQPPDFPISREEPAYLKTVWLRIS
ncbi:MAG TPA: pseudouridine synthase [Methylomirabilota bacterium]|nr:pseudouridine synthase [Methylomirabilota bacterium]